MLILNIFKMITYPLEYLHVPPGDNHWSKVKRQRVLGCKYLLVLCTKVFHVGSSCVQQKCNFLKHLLE